MRLVTRKRAAKDRGVSIGTVDKWRKMGLLTTHKLPGLSKAVRLDLAEVRKLTSPENK